MHLNVTKRVCQAFSCYFHILPYTNIYLIASISKQKCILLCEGCVAPLADYSIKFRSFLSYTLFRIAYTMMSPLDGRSFRFLGDYLRYFNDSDTTLVAFWGWYSGLSWQFRKKDQLQQWLQRCVNVNYAKEPRNKDTDIRDTDIRYIVIRWVDELVLTKWKIRNS